MTEPILLRLDEKRIIGEVETERGSNRTVYLPIDWWNSISTFEILASRLETVIDKMSTNDKLKYTAKHYQHQAH